MEILVALVIGFILYSFFSSNESPSDSSSSGQNTGSRNQKEPLYLKVSKDQDKKDGFTFFNVAAAGLLPNHYDMNLVGALYIYDEETKLPFVSNFDITNGRVLDVIENPGTVFDLPFKSYPLRNCTSSSTYPSCLYE